jgi:putative endonuclease
MNSKQLTGILGEMAAAGYLKRTGYSILGKNYRCIFGEIDIIALKEKTIHFIEVKTRKSIEFGEPSESIDFFKLEKIKKCAWHYLFSNNCPDHQVAFDAVLIIRQKNRTSIEFIEDIIR